MKLIKILQEITIKPAISFNNTNDVISTDSLPHYRNFILLDLGSFYADIVNDSVILIPKNLIQVRNKVEGSNLQYFIPYFDQMERLYKKGNYIIIKNLDEYTEIHG